MNKKVVLIASLYALCSSYMTIISMEHPDEDPGNSPKVIQAQSKSQQEKNIPSVKLTQSREVDLDASSWQRKAANFAWGTDTYLLDELR